MQDKTLLDQILCTTRRSREALQLNTNHSRLWPGISAAARSTSTIRLTVEAMKLSMLRSVRPETFKVLEEIAAALPSPLSTVRSPVSSLVRPEQYQHVLHQGESERHLD